MNLTPIYGSSTATTTLSAINPDTLSWWSRLTGTEVVTNNSGNTSVVTVDFRDGATVSQGGAAEETPDDERKLYTFIPTVSSLKSKDLSQNPLSTSIDPTYWGLESSASSADISSVYRLAQGAWGAVIHNRPKIVSQKLQFDSLADGGFVNGSINTVYFGDNAGYIHAINAGEVTSSSPVINKANTGGNELWAFAPVETLGNFGRLKFDNSFAGDNSGGKYRTRYVYGVDGQIEIVANDKERDGDYTGADDRLALYFGLRRGGSAYYGLDISRSMTSDVTGYDDAPRLKFRLYSTFTTTVEGAQADGNIRLERLAETWSPMVSTKIRWKGELKDVLVFGGGYHPEANETEIGTMKTPADLLADSSTQLGNALYVVDADTGLLYGYMSSILSQASSTLVSDAVGVSYANMKYSIPGQVAVVDVDGNGADYLYATDTGGQLFRVELDPAAGVLSGATPTPLFSNPTTIAQLGREGATASDGSDQRVFFEGPDAAVLESGDLKGGILVAMGSGFRPELKNSLVQDYIIAYFDPLNGSSIGNQPSSPYQLDDFVDVTSNVLVNNAVSQIADTSNAYIGWKIALDKANAEKLSGAPKVVRDRVFLATFDNVGEGDCADSIGNSNAYAMNLDGTAIFANGRVINTSDGFSSTGSLLVNPKGSLDTYFLANTEAVCLEGDCLNSDNGAGGSSTGSINTQTTASPPAFIQDLESLIRTKWRQCMDSDFTDCGADY